MFVQKHNIEVENWNVSGKLCLCEISELFCFCFVSLRKFVFLFAIKSQVWKSIPQMEKNTRFFSVKERVSSWIIYANLINWIAEQNN